MQKGELNVWLKESEFEYNINNEKIECSICGEGNLYTNEVCTNCGASLHTDKLKAKNLIDNFAPERYFPSDEEAEKAKYTELWIKRLEKYFAGDMDANIENKLVVEPIELIMDQRGYYYFVDMLEESDALTKCIFQKTSYAVPEKVILKMAQRGYLEEVAEYLELMAEKKSKVPGFKKLVEELAIFFDGEDPDDEENIEFATALMDNARKISEDCTTFVSIMLIEFDAKYCGAQWVRWGHLLFKYYDMFHLIENGGYLETELAVCKKVFNILMGENDEMLVKIWMELYEVAKNNWDEVLVEVLGKLFLNYYSSQGCKKTRELLEKNPNLKENIFMTFVTIPEIFISYLFGGESCEEFSWYFDLIMQNTNFLSCKREVVNLFNMFGENEPEDFNSTLVVKKAAMLLPYDYRDELETPMWDDDHFMYFTPKNVEDIEEIDNTEVDDEEDDYEEVASESDDQEWLVDSDEDLSDEEGNGIEIEIPLGDYLKPFIDYYKGVISELENAYGIDSGYDSSDSDYDDDSEYDSDSDYEYDYNKDDRIWHELDEDSDYDSDDYDYDSYDKYGYDLDLDLDENDDEYDEYDNELELSEYEDILGSDYEDYEGYTKDEIEELIEDAEDYAYLASTGGGSYNDDDRDLEDIDLEMDETFEDMMMAKGLNQFDPDSYD